MEGGIIPFKNVSSFRVKKQDGRIYYLNRKLSNNEASQEASEHNMCLLYINM